MKTLIIYYSYTGHTDAVAKKLAERESADIEEIVDSNRPGKLKVFTLGCYNAIKGNPWPINPPKADLNSYDRLILLSPIWAGNPAPVFNALLDILPAGKAIELKMVSSSGSSNCEARLRSAIEAKGCTITSYEDIKN